MEILEEIIKTSEDIEVGDQINFGGQLVTVERIVTNNHDERVWHLKVDGIKFKSRSKMMVIIPKKIPIITVK